MPKPRLFHVSEEAGIAHFAPRPNYRRPGEMVWAVDERHLVNFLTPRDCPRITFGRRADTTDADVERLQLHAWRVVAFEAAWLDRVRGCALTLYELPPQSFEPEDHDAGYWVSAEAVTPLASRTETDLLGALARAGAEVRIVQDFWALRDAVVSSSAEFSIIHQDRAAPRTS